MTNLVELLRVLRRRIPGRYLPNLGCELFIQICVEEFMCTVFIKVFAVDFLHHKSLRKNLKDLVGIDETDTKNIGRHFWSWLNKQKWRKMLPRPFPFLG